MGDPRRPSLAWGSLPQGTVCRDGVAVLQEVPRELYPGGDCGGYTLNFRNDFKRKIR